MMGKKVSHVPHNFVASNDNNIKNDINYESNGTKFSTKQ